MGVIMLNKPATEQADGLVRLLKNVERQDREEEKTGAPIIEITGDLEFFSQWEMDLWRGHLRFTIRGKVEQEPDAETDAAMGHIYAALANQGHHDVMRLLSSPATMTVEKLMDIQERKEIYVDGKLESKDAQTRQEWRDYTTEFAKLLDRERAWLG